MARVLVHPRPFRRVHDKNKIGQPRLGWVYVSHQHEPDATARRALRGAMVRLVRPDTGRTIYRRLGFRPTLRVGARDVSGEGHDAPPAELALDWDSWLELLDDDEKANASYPLRIERAFALLPMLGVGHPEPSVRASATLGLAGLATGLISLMVSLLLAL